MYFPKSAFVFSFLALTNIAAASTPACLLSAVGTTLSNPADLNDACVKNSDKLQKQIANTCGDDDLQDALDYYSKTCAQAGHKVDVNISSSSSSPTGTSSAGSKSTGFTTATAATSSKSTSSGSQTGSSSASAASSTETTNSGSSDRHVSAAAFAAVVFVGFAATL
ncbi:hypothetical protein BJX96DRAFT_178270 [Aspergillus floccosus]